MGSTSWPPGFIYCHWGLLGLARSACADNKNIVFARRVVTREASSAEDNEQMSFDGFREALACGDLGGHVGGVHGECIPILPGTRFFTSAR